MADDTHSRFATYNSNVPLTTMRHLLNVTHWLRPRVTFSTSGSSYFHVPLKYSTHYRASSVKCLINSTALSSGSSFTTAKSARLGSADKSLLTYSVVQEPSVSLVSGNILLLHSGGDVACRYSLPLLLLFS